MYVHTKKFVSQKLSSSNEWNFFSIHFGATNVFFSNKRVQQYNGQINYTQMITICGKTLRDQGS